MEAQLAFAALVVRACGDFASSLSHAGDAVNATRYTSTAKKLAQTLRARKSVAGGEWYTDYGLHASAYLINAKIVATEASKPRGEIKQTTNQTDTLRLTLASLTDGGVSVLCSIVFFFVLTCASHCR